MGLAKRSSPRGKRCRLAGPRGELHDATATSRRRTRTLDRGPLHLRLGDRKQGRIAFTLVDALPCAERVMTPESFVLGEGGLVQAVIARKMASSRWLGAGGHRGRPGWRLRGLPCHDARRPRPTRHDSIFYCVANLPGEVPNASTYAQTDVLLTTRTAIWVVR